MLPSAVLLLVGALFGWPWGEEAGGRDLVLLLDLSRSHGEPQELLEEGGPRLLATGVPEAGDRLAVVGFARRALLLVAPVGRRGFETAWRRARSRLGELAAGFREGSRPARALDLAARLKRSGHPLLLYLAGDGRYGPGAVAALEERVQKAGFGLLRLGPLLPTPEDPYLALAGPPPLLEGGVSVQLSLKLVGPVASPRRVGVAALGRQVMLLMRPGEATRFSLRVTPKKGARRVVVRISDPGGADANLANDRLELACREPQRRALLVVGSQAEQVGKLLARAGYRVLWTLPAAQAQKALLERADACLLADAPAGPGGLSPAFQEALVRAVKRQGLGLLVTGGPRAFGAGLYGSSPLERLLPLGSKPGGRRRLVVLLDHSGSMEQGGRLARGVEAVLRLAAGLSSQDRLQVVGFGGVPDSPLPPKPADPRRFRLLAAPLLLIQAAGPTRLVPALERGLRLFEEVPQPSWKRLLVVLSDFRDEELVSRLPDLKRQLLKQDVEPLSVVLDPDATSRKLAAGLGGRVVEAPRITPRLLLQAVRGKGWRRGRFQVLEKGGQSRRLAGLNPVRRVVGARLELATEGGRPLVATIRRGAGLVRCLATDLLLEPWARSALVSLLDGVLPPRRHGQQAWWDGGRLLFRLPEESPITGPLKVLGGDQPVLAREFAPDLFEAEPEGGRPGALFAVLDGAGRLLARLHPPPRGDPEWEWPVAWPREFIQAAPTRRLRPRRWPFLLPALPLLFLLALRGGPGGGRKKNRPSRHVFP